MHIEGGAPDAIRRPQRGDCEIVVAAAGALVGKPLGPGIGRAGVPGQRGDRGQFGAQGVSRRTGRAGGQVHADEISAVGCLGARENDGVNRLVHAGFVVAPGSGQGAAANIYVGISAGHVCAEHEPPAGQQVGRHIDLEIMPGAAPAVREAAGGRKDQRFEDRIGARAEVRAVGGQEHLEGMCGRGARCGDAQAIGAGGVLGGFEVDLVGLAVEAGGEIENRVGRRAAQFQQQVRVGGGVIGDDERKVGRADAGGESEVGPLAWGVGADERLGRGAG